jgi:serine/threonine protein kinase
MTKTGILKIGTVVTAESGQQFRLKKALTSGHHGVSFLADPLTNANGAALKEVFIKSVNLKRRTNADEVQKRLKRLHGTFQGEVLHKPRLAKVPNIAHVTAYGTSPLVIHDCEFGVPFLVQEYIDGIEFDKYLKLKTGNSKSPFKGLVSAVEWLILAKQLISIIDSIHSEQVIHGDIWNANILMSGEQPILIDFGQSFIRDIHLCNDTPSFKDNVFLAPERLRNSGRSWEAPADIYSLGVLLYYCASGREVSLNQNPITNGDLRDYITTSLSNINPHIYRDNRCIVHILARCLCYQPHDRSEAADLLRLTESILGGQTQRNQTSPEEISIKLRSLAKRKRQSSQLPPLFRRLYDYSLSSFVRRTHQLMAFQRLDISGDRNEMINFMIEFLSVLEPGDYYWTVTTPDFWSKSNLGTRGRFYDINFLMCKKGVYVKRVFLTTKDEVRKKSLKSNLFRAQYEMNKELKTLGVNVTSDEAESAACYTGVTTCRNDKERQQKVNDGYIVGLSRVSGVYYSLSFKPEASGTLVRRLAIEMPKEDKIKRHMDKIKELLTESTNILEFAKTKEE